MSARRRCVLAVAVSLLASAALAARGQEGGTAAVERPPNVLVITIDALRADRVSGYGYGKPTTPALDALMAEGARFTDAYTPEPLTAPAMCALQTGLEPDIHGASRNAVPLRPGLDSLPKTLARHGYRTVAFVSNWTLRDRLTGLGRHFDDYREILEHKRWFGLVAEEATAVEVNAAVRKWMQSTGSRRLSGTPWMVWIHYVDPHAPYKLRESTTERLGYRARNLGKAERYDTEVAATDDAVGEILPELLAPDALGPDTLVVFAADHGESLGEHGYWGHGRNLYQESVAIPLAIRWHGHVAPKTIDAPASLLDVMPTVIGLTGVDRDPRKQPLIGFDWTPVLTAGAAPPEQRLLLLQAHKGAALGRQGGPAARESGLLEVGVVRKGRKESWRPGQRRLLTFDLAADPHEVKNLTPTASGPTPLLAKFLHAVERRLKELGLPARTLDPEEIEKLKALGYLQ